MIRLQFLFFVIIFCANYSNMSGQQTVSLAEIEKAYKGDFTISSTAVYKYYPDYSKGPASDSLEATMAMCGNDSYFEIADYEIITQGQYTVTADHDQKIITVSKIKDNQTQLSFGLIDDLLSQQSAKPVSFDTGNELQFGIRINYQNNEVIQAELYIDKKTNFIQKCVIKYIDGLDESTQTLRYAKIEINYTDYKKNDAKLLNVKYGLNKIISIYGNTITLNSSYKLYELQTFLN